MAIKFNTVGQIEKTYPFEDAVVDVEVLNGAFGEVRDGKFTVAENATKAVMNVENGDDAGLDEYNIPAGSPVRVIDLVSLAEQYPKNTKVEIYGAQLPATYKKGDKLVSDVNGKLVVSEGASAPYFEITNVIGNKSGVEVNIVTE